MINDLIKKLRKAADILDDLLDYNPTSNGYAAQEIGKRIEKLKKGHRKVSHLTGSRKPYKLKKEHWMKNPRNKAKMMKMIAKMHRARRAALKAKQVKV